MGDDDLSRFVDEASETLVQTLEPPDRPGENPSDDVASEVHPIAHAPSGASVMVPPPPPPPEEELARARGRAAVAVIFPWGKIAYYASKNSFEAICRNPAHGKCVLTRSAKGKVSRAGKLPAGGRPLGFMASWLQQGHVGSKADHSSQSVMHAPLARRIAARNFVKGARFGADLLSYERPKAEDQGEGSEPEDLSAYA